MSSSRRSLCSSPSCSMRIFDSTFSPPSATLCSGDRGTQKQRALVVAAERIGKPCDVHDRVQMLMNRFGSELLGRRRAPSGPQRDHGAGYRSTAHGEDLMIELALLGSQVNHYR